MSARAIRDDIIGRKCITYERKLIEAELSKHGSVAATAEALGMTRRLLLYRIKATGADIMAGWENAERALQEEKDAKRAIQEAKKRENESRNSATKERADRKRDAWDRRHGGAPPDPECENRERYLALCAAEQQLRRDLGSK